MKIRVIAAMGAALAVGTAVALDVETAKWQAPLDAALVPAPQKTEWKTGTCPAEAAVKEMVDASIPPGGYRLDVEPDVVAITSADDAGAFYARQTLAQLRREAGGRASYPCCHIEDAPAFAWRGLLLDESRHFFGAAAVRRFLDLMAEHKLNVLHWHLTDNQGWRIALDRYPQLTAVGARRAYSKDHKHLLDTVPAGTSGEYGPFFYTKAQIRELVAYAAARHVRVIPEIEIPGHSRAALRAFPELLCFADDPAARPTNAVDNVYCVGNPATYRLLEGVLDEVCALFPDPVVHIGGDEVKKVNWEACPKCRAKMAELGVSTPEALQAKVNGHFADYLAKKGKRAIWWGEIAEAAVPENVMVMSWLDEKCGIAAAKAGHEVVMCPHRSLYFDYTPCLADDPCVYPWFTEKLPAEKVYAYDPLAGIPPECHRFIIGGEACNWAEYTCDEKTLDWKVWTRAAAMAEVFWTGANRPGFSDFRRRMAAHRRRLLARGVNCAPLD